MKENHKILTIGQVAKRTGLSIPTIRYYEMEGLIFPARSAGGQREFISADIRRLSFILIAQQLGFSLQEIRAKLGSLPNNRTPTQDDWASISRSFREALQARIDMATRMRDRLDSCIGCGCLSLSSCELYNPADKVKRFGPGPQHILQDMSGHKR